MTKLLAALSLLVVCVAPSVQAQIIYVDLNATGSGTGTSWPNAYITLQEGLAAASSGDTIWVADGTYYPDVSNGGAVNTDDRASTFQLIDGVVLYGGFSGGETDLSQRDPASYSSILSGDLLQNDGANFSNNGDNAYHVVNGSGVLATAVIDGFTITAGNASGGGLLDDRGGGILSASGNPTITGNTIAYNRASNIGGGILSAPLVDGSSISDNTITGNIAPDGAGIYVAGTGESTISRNTIHDNRATLDGGGIYTTHTRYITANTISDNTAGRHGAGIYIEDSPSIKGNTIVSNVADNAGGGIRTDGDPTIVSTILYGNSDGGGTNAAAQISVFSGGAPTVSYSIVRDSVPPSVIDGGDNVFANPLLGPLADNGGPTFTMLPSGLSPAVDAGTCAAQTIDQRGETRPFDVASRPDADDQCDIGAVELQSNDPINTDCEFLCYVDASATGTQQGDSWDNAFVTLQDALSGADSGDQIWVAAGTYYPDLIVGGLIDTDNRTASFILESGVSLYGGFAGGEGSLLARDPASNPTILSGDLTQNDGANFANNGENAYHVVTASGVDATARIDGFTITAGNANDGSAPNNRGGGIYMDAGSPTITGNTIEANSASNGGGLYHINGSGPLIEENTFEGNRATSSGGAILSSGGTAILTGNTIVGNTATLDGGGIYNFDNTSAITANTITGNDALSDGGGIFNLQASPSLVGNTIVGNTATAVGGGISNSTGSNPTITSTILFGNTDVTGVAATGQIFNTASAPTASHSLIEGGLSAGTIDGGNNLDADPLLSVLQDNGGPTETMLPGGNSPVLDTGTCSGQTTDQRGEPRPFDGADPLFPNTDDGCDIGSVEVQTLSTCSVMIAARAFLEGPYNSTTGMMNQDLKTAGHVPLGQPFDEPEFDSTHLEYDVGMTLESLPDSAVDWVMVGLRTQTDGGETVEAPALISNNGYLFTPGIDSLCLESNAPSMHYLTVGGRNHIQVMSASQLDLTGLSGSYDFTTAATQAYPGDNTTAQKEVEAGVFGLFAADQSLDGQVTASDFNAWLAGTKNAAVGYLLTDFDLDGQVTVADFNLWLANTKLGASSKVPSISTPPDE